MSPDDKPVRRTWEYFELAPPVSKAHLVAFDQVEYHPANIGTIYPPHMHVIKDDWSTEKKNAVAKHLDLMHAPPDPAPDARSKP